MEVKRVAHQAACSGAFALYGFAEDRRKVNQQSLVRQERHVLRVYRAHEVCLDRTRLGGRQWSQPAMYYRLVALKDVVMNAAIPCCSKDFVHALKQGVIAGIGVSTTETGRLCMHQDRQVAAIGEELLVL